mmetsp:Transcript_13/g.28  ORF Transcript_13/g.28 Transcript_13/m.28 type:complete len:204 (+) Transcript_13:1603-2214(+)
MLPAEHQGKSVRWGPVGEVGVGEEPNHFFVAFLGAHGSDDQRERPGLPFHRGVKRLLPLPLNQQLRHDRLHFHAHQAAAPPCGSGGAPCGSEEGLAGGASGRSKLSGLGPRSGYARHRPREELDHFRFRACLIQRTCRPKPQRRKSTASSTGPTASSSARDLKELPEKCRGRPLPAPLHRGLHLERHPLTQQSIVAVPSCHCR